MEKAFGPDHPEVAYSLNSLAGLYQDQRRYADAEALYKRALAIREKAVGPQHPEFAASLNDLADLYKDQGRYADALGIVQRNIAQNQANKSIALSVIYGAQAKSIIAPTEAANMSFTVVQQWTSSAAGDAILTLMTKR
jgi:tetratricopeptide (TPR) repeat protein